MNSGGRRQIFVWPAVIVTLLASTASKCASSTAQGTLPEVKSGQCKPGDPLAGVYFPWRLHVRNRCMTVRGTVDCESQEPDGDVHIRLLVDPRFRGLLTPANAAQQCPGNTSPHLVVEIIPQRGHLPFPTNSADRGGFITPKAPPPGAHITVTGPYVWDSNALHDLEHVGKDTVNWAEIHPAWNITVGTAP